MGPRVPGLRRVPPTHVALRPANGGAGRPAPRVQVAERLLRALCALWAVPAEALEQYASLRKPAVSLGAADVSIGRATLPLLDAGVAARTRQAMQAAAGGAGGGRFAPTGHALRNMERVAVAAARSEPVLLVGETGTGKTTLVQQIAKQVGGRAGRRGVVWCVQRASRTLGWPAAPSGSSASASRSWRAHACRLPSLNAPTQVGLPSPPPAPTKHRWAPAWRCST